MRAPLSTTLCCIWVFASSMSLACGPQGVKAQTTTGTDSSTSSAVSASTSGVTDSNAATTSPSSNTGSSSETAGLPPGCGDGVVDPGQYCFQVVWLPDLGEPTNSKTGSAATLDLDGDGRDELVVETLGVAAGVNTPLWYDDDAFHPGTGVAGVRDLFDWIAWDWDSDERVDLVVLPHQTSGEALVMRSSGNGLLDAEHVVVSTDDELLVNGPLVPIDIEGDGVLEFVIAVELPLVGKGAHVRKLVGDTWMEVGAVLPLPGCGAAGARVYGDFDEDGHLDVVLHDIVTACKPYPEDYEPDFHRFSSFRANPVEGTVDLVGTFATGGYGESGMWTSDFDGDGHLDVAIQLQASIAVAVHRGKGDGSFESPQLITEIPGLEGNWRLHPPADLDGDGDLEYLGNAGERRFIVEELTGSPNVVDLPASTPGMMVSGDFNGDNAVDFLDGGFARTGEKFVMMSVP